MQLTARDVMTTRVHTLKPEQTVADAVRIFREASEEEGRKVFGMIVTDDANRLIGMLSMYDILLFIRPKHIHVWGTMDDIDISGLMSNACDRARSILVGDIMSTDVISVTPDTHLMLLLDLMINKHIRRIPVLENDNILGIVYISDLFYNLLDKLST
jgi:CBS domain-containing protein